MPTSKVLFGKVLSNVVRPVPSIIAADTATIFSSFFARSVNLFPKIDEYDFPAPIFFATFPLVLSNGPTPWKLDEFLSAMGYPLPFFVTTWRKTESFAAFASFKLYISSSKLCPSMGPI